MAGHITLNSASRYAILPRMATEYTIGELAKAADVASSTLRYYERRGLVQPDNRSGGNYRLYGQDTLERVRFIRAAQATGFTLDDIVMLLDVRVTASTACEDVQVLMEERLANVNNRMAELKHVEAVLTSFLDKCRATKRRGHCAVIEELNAACCPTPPKSSANVPRIAGALRESGFESSFTDIESRLRLDVLRLVAKGRPVAKSRIDKLAAGLGMEADSVTTFISKVSEQDSKNRVIGIFGLSQKRHPHSFEVNGQMLFTWCAWDALFLPALLKQTAEVASVCPVTKREILLTVTPKHVKEVLPRETVISMVIPKLKGTGPPAAKEVWKSFCQHVRFFTSEYSAKRWTSRKKDLRILSVDEAYELGRQSFGHFLK